MQKLYLATTLPGIGVIAKHYLKEKFGNDFQLKESLGVRNNDLLIFSYRGELAKLLRPSMLEDVFILLHKQRLLGDKQDLKLVRRLLAEATIPRWQTRGNSVRVVVQAADANWRAYRRLELKKSAEIGLVANHAKLRVVEENAAVEVWLQQVGKDLLISSRLTDHTMRHRDYKVANYPGSLRPTVANAMVFLSHPEADDVFLDPMCGAGTILLERAVAARYKLLVGFDKSEQAVTSALQNFGSRHKPWMIAQSDVTRRLPVADASQTKVVTNPPWGVQMPKSREFYSSMLAEISRVLIPSGIFVCLMKEGLISNEILNSTGLKLQQKYTRVIVLGQKAEILVCRKA